MRCAPLRRIELATVLGVAALAATAAGCDDFATPAQLMVPTVVGIVAEPPVVKPGESTRLTPLIASPDGPQPPAAASWSLIETLPGVAPFGQLTAHADGSATYRAPMELPPLPENALPIDSVELQLPLGGRMTSTLKAVLVTDVTTANPVIAAVTADGLALAEGATLEIPAGATIELAVSSAPEATDRTRYAWYASIGEIEDYQSSPCRYVAETAGSGWLYIVVRDGLLGVAWRAISVTVR